jgi:hypothetical protein
MTRTEGSIEDVTKKFVDHDLVQKEQTKIRKS